MESSLKYGIMVSGDTSTLILMTVLKATTEEKNSLEQFRNGNWAIKFIQDADGNWIIGQSILENNKYTDVKSELEALEEIPYNPVIEEEA